MPVWAPRSVLPTPRARALCQSDLGKSALLAQLQALLLDVQQPVPQLGRLQRDVLRTSAGPQPSAQLYIKTQNQT